jgi:hypothetical protein
MKMSSEGAGTYGESIAELVNRDAAYTGELKGYTPSRGLLGSECWWDDSRVNPSVRIAQEDVEADAVTVYGFTGNGIEAWRMSFRSVPADFVARAIVAMSLTS